MAHRAQDTVFSTPPGSSCGMVAASLRASNGREPFRHRGLMKEGADSLPPSPGRNAQALEFLEGLLAEAHHPTLMFQNLSSRLMELSGATVVLLNQHLAMMGPRRDRLLSVLPSHAHALAESEACQHLLQSVQAEDQPTCLAMTSPDHRPALLALNMKSGVGIPLLSTSQLLGSILLLYETAEEPTADLRALLDHLSHSLVHIFRISILMLGQETLIRERSRLLRDSEAMFRGLAASAPVGIFRTDAQGRCLYVNPRWTEITERPLTKTSLEPWFLESAPEDLPAIEQAWRQAIREGREFHSVHRIIRPSGQVRWVEARVVQEQQATPVCLIGTLRDITDEVRQDADLRSSEARYRRLFEEASDGVFLHSPEGTLLDANRAGCALLMVPKEKLLSHHLQDFVHDRSQADARRLIAASANGEPVRGDLELVRADGEKMTVDWSERLIDDGTGTVQAIARDVTTQRRMEERLRQSQTLAALGTMAGGVAHEFNNILAAVLGNAELALELSKEGIPLEECLREILGASERASELVKKMLVLGRRARPTLGPVRLEALVNDVLQGLRFEVPPSVNLRRSLERDVVVSGDSVHLRQMLFNIIRNSLEAMSSGGGTLTLTANLAPPHHEAAIRLGRPLALLSVQDTGEGMSEEVQKRVFEPFFTTHPGNSGLGMAVVHGIVAAHGGCVELESALGVGTLVRVALPLFRAPAMAG